MLFVLFVVATWPAWLVIGGILLFESLLTLHWDESSEAVGFGALVFWLTIIGLILFTNIATPVVPFVTWPIAVLTVGAYLVAGVVWSFKEWIDYLKRKLAYVNKWMSANATPENRRAAIDKARPTAMKNKGRLIGYMVLWPMYFVTWVILLPRHVYTWIFNQLSAVYDRVAEKVFA